MPVTINGTTGIVSPGVDSTNLILDGSTSGGITLLAPAVAGSNTQTLVATTGTLAPIVSDTAKTATGTSVDFTGIPSWVKRITVIFNGISTSGTSTIILQLGDSGGVETTNYFGTLGQLSGSPTGTSITGGFGLVSTPAAASNFYGQAILSLLSASSNFWAHSSHLSASGAVMQIGAGGKTTSDTLDRVRITTANGTDTFDAGTINILYE
jgi:hypothetical protein